MAEAFKKPEYAPYAFEAEMSKAKLDQLKKYLSWLSVIGKKTEITPDMLAKIKGHVHQKL